MTNKELKKLGIRKYKWNKHTKILTIQFTNLEYKHCPREKFKLNDLYKINCISSWYALKPSLHDVLSELGLMGYSEYLRARACLSVGQSKQLDNHVTKEGHKHLYYHSWSTLFKKFLEQNKFELNKTSTRNKGFVLNTEELLEELGLDKLEYYALRAICTSDEIRELSYERNKMGARNYHTHKYVELFKKFTQKRFNKRHWDIKRIKGICIEVVLSHIYKQKTMERESFEDTEKRVLEQQKFTKENQTSIIVNKDHPDGAIVVGLKEYKKLKEDNETLIKRINKNNEYHKQINSICSIKESFYKNNKPFNNIAERVNNLIVKMTEEILTLDQQNQNKESELITIKNLCKFELNLDKEILNRTEKEIVDYSLHILRKQKEEAIKPLKKLIETYVASEKDYDKEIKELTDIIIQINKDMFGSKNV